MDSYSLVKTLHVLSAIVLFGTGLGTAFFFWRAHAKGNEDGRLVAARTTVLADLFFTTPAVIVQPITGVWLALRAGFDWGEPWLTGSVLLYLLAGACWLPVVAIQLRMKRMLESADRGERLDCVKYDRLFRWWFALGWPAFGALTAVVFLMVAKPSW